MMWRCLKLAAMLAIGACGSKEPTNVLGTYRSSGKCADEILTLTSEGKFMHSYGQKVTYAGTWKVEGKTISLTPFRAWTPEPTEERPESENLQAQIAQAAMGERVTISLKGGCAFVRK